MRSGQWLGGGDHAGSLPHRHRHPRDRLREVRLPHGHPGRMSVTEDHSARAQRAPTHVSAAIPPAHPRRAPDAAGNPVPAHTEAPVPAAVVVRGPAPGIVGHERPAPLGQDPVAVPVGTPAHRGSGYPHAAVIRDVLPVAVRREPIDEDLLVYLPAGGFRCGHGRGRLSVHLVARGGRRRREGRLGLVADHLALNDAAAERADSESGEDQAV